ncbi:unnamed protein product [Plutella xylostella]|uniref:(diamondback moth) hypothetical protein n=1 Tax=Plutella xylostella TaxID=51655 RepID=A0A8S4ETF2_PLUXY|nr:unnamed protein product [Plutella xylostella]
MTRRKDSPSSTPPPEPGPSRAAAPAPETTPSPEPAQAPAPATAPAPAPAPAPEPTPPTNIEIPKPLGKLKGPESPTSPIAVEHPVATRPFTKAAWKRKSSEVEMEKPVEEPSPENALRRRIAFVTQASACFSEDHDDGEGEGSPPGAGGEVGSLQEAVALARVRLAAHSPSSQQSQQSAPGDTDDTEEEGFADAMPPAPYGALMEAEGAAAAPSEVSAVTARAPPDARACVSHDLRGGGGRVLPERVRVLRLQQRDGRAVPSTFHFTLVFSGAARHASSEYRGFIRCSCVLASHRFYFNSIVQYIYEHVNLIYEPLLPLKA